MSKVNPDNYITVQGWMVTDLDLKGNELLVYAIIYGFTQDGESTFNGSRQYLADWCNCSVRSIQTTLNNLVDKKYIVKFEYLKNGVKYCSYATNFTGSENFSRGSENFSLNNIVNNNSNSILSKDNIHNSAEQVFDFGISETKSKKKSNDDEYSDCCLLIDTFTTDLQLRAKLKELFSNKVYMCGKQRHHFYASTCKNYLEDLSKVNDKLGAVKLSIQYNNTMKVMEPNTNSTGGIKGINETFHGQNYGDNGPKATNSDGTLMKF